MICSLPSSSPTMESPAVIMVAVSKHSSSVSAVTWALSNQLVLQGGSIKLVHIRPPVRSIPTPMGNFVPVEQLSPEIVAAYMRDIQSKTEQRLQVHQRLCDKWKVQAEFVIVESDLVTTALLEQISRFRVKKFIMGTSTSNPIIRKLKGTSIPEHIAKHASKSCTVLVVSKGRLVSVKESNCLSSPPVSPHVNAESQPNVRNLNGSIQNEFFNRLMVQRDIGGFISQPLHIQREKAAATINRMHKARESYDSAKEETKRREEALIAAQQAKNGAAAEAIRSDEALVSTEAAKLAKEREAQWRKEAEDQADQESFFGQEARVALVQAKAKYREYSYEDMEAATNYFCDDNQIGEGGYGAVYRGKLHHTTVAIKVLKKGGVQGPQEFQQEVELLSHVRHPHMVLLLGACPEKGCLVYEYLANGSLEDRLFCKGNTQPIPWHARFRISAEVATALLFLHSSKPDPVVHRDLKPANILLDQNFVSKIGDVGLARLAPGIISYSVTEYRETVPVGTFAYIDPEYQRTGIFCPRSDVYALGIVMLQLLTGKGPIGVTNIVENALEDNTLNEVLDSSAGDWPIHEATELAKLAIKCSALRRKDRLDLEMCVLPKLTKLRAFADEYVARMLWGKQTIMDNGLVVPSFFLCPIVKEAMEDPHIAADGFTYEYGAIKQWLQDHNTSPMTNLKLSHKHLTPNHSLRSAILEWRHKVLCTSV